MRDQAYTAIVSGEGRSTSHHLRTPSDWSLPVLHEALRRRGFRPARPIEDKGRVGVGLTVRVEPKIVGPSDKNPTIGPLSGPQAWMPEEPNEQFSEGGTIEEVVTALKEIGLIYETTATRGS